MLIRTHQVVQAVKVLREMECGFYNSVGRSKVNRFVTISKDLSVKAKMATTALTHAHTRIHIQTQRHTHMYLDASLLFFSHSH